MSDDEIRAIATRAHWVGKGGIWLKADEAIALCDAALRARAVAAALVEAGE